MPQSILSMPKEILRMIFQLVKDAKFSRRFKKEGKFRHVETIWDLNSSCRELRPMALDVWYSTTPIEIRSIKQLFKFVRTLLDRPHVADSVKKLNILCGSWERRNLNVISGDYDDKMRDDAAAVINSFSQDKVLSHYWVHEQLRIASFDSVIALAMILLRGLRELTFKIDCHDSSNHQFDKHNPLAFSFMHKVLYEAAKRDNSKPFQGKLNQAGRELGLSKKGPGSEALDYSSPILQSLRLVHLGLFTNRRSGHIMDHPAAFCKLKSVKCFVATWVRPYILETVGPSSLETSIDDLQILNLQIPAPFKIRFFEEFISCFSSLQVLSFWTLPQCYEQVFSCKTYSRYFGWHPMNRIVRSIAHLNARLRKLSLAPASQVHYLTYGNSIMGSIPSVDTTVESLSEFGNLTCIDVVAFDLWVYHKTIIEVPDEWDDLMTLPSFITPLNKILPKSIVDLCLQESGMDTLLHVLQFLELEESLPKTPKLRTIELVLKRGYRIDDGFHTRLIEYMEKLALGRDVTLTVLTRAQAGLPSLPKLCS